MQRLENLKTSLECPITLVLFKDPITIECGHSFERNALREHCHSNAADCPLCRESIKKPISDYATNITLRDLVQAIRHIKIEPSEKETVVKPLFNHGNQDMMPSQHNIKARANALQEKLYGHIGNNSQTLFFRQSNHAKLSPMQNDIKVRAQLLQEKLYGKSERNKIEKQNNIIGSDYFVQTVDNNIPNNPYDFFMNTEIVNSRENEKTKNKKCILC